MEKFNAYKERAEKRFKSLGLLPRPLSGGEIDEFFQIINNENDAVKTLADGINTEVEFLDKKVSLGKLLVELIKNEVLRGTFPESYRKAENLYALATEAKKSNLITKDEALDMLIDMKGGAAAPCLVKLIKVGANKAKIINSLEETVIINKEDFDELALVAETDAEVQELIKKWAEKIFAKKWNLKDEYVGKGIKVGDFISTDHLSPGKRSDSRTDKPFHATFIMDGRPEEADFMERLKKLKADGDVFIVGGNGFGEGSSRKSATYTVLEVIGKKIEGEPENKTGGVIIAKSIAPIFRNSLVSSSVLPIICDTTDIKETDTIKIDVKNNKLIINGKNEIAFQPIPEMDLEKIKAGGVNNFVSGKELQTWAVDYCEAKGIAFDKTNVPEKLKEDAVKKPMNLAEKMVAYNRIDGKTTVKAGEEATIRVRGVFSQDTTGPMTMEEYQVMAGGMRFGAEFVVQSLCHTCEAPSSEDVDKQKFLTSFVKARGGVGLKSGEGIIHTIGNRFSLPTDIIVGGDSHTRTPRGIAFPGASDIVASCMKYGKMDIIMDKVVKVEFFGELQPGITARDMVSMIVLEAEKQGFGKDIYTGKIIEMYGIEKLSAEEKYMLTNAVAERSASAGVIQADENTIKELKQDLEYLKSRRDAKTSPSVINTIKSFEAYLANPVFLRPDEGAEYAAVVKVDISQYKEPLIAKPHHPDNIAPLSEIAGIKVDEVYIGSCVGGEFESVSSAAAALDGKKLADSVNFVVSPAAEDITKKLADSGDIQKIIDFGGTIIMPTCGLCMGNKRRIGSNSTAITTTTRNFRGRLGPANSGTYLGSSLVASCCAILGRFPTVEEYMNMVVKK